MLADAAPRASLSAEACVQPRHRYRAARGGDSGPAPAVPGHGLVQRRHFNDKYRALPTTVAFLAETRHYTLDQFVFHAFLTNLAAFDTGIAAWYFKRRYDSVRPFSAIHYLNRGRTVTAWGGPGRGTVTDLPGAEWRSYLSTADHPDYPSGSASICAAHAQASRRFTGRTR
jgi:hypothetical protein